MLNDDTREKKTKKNSCALYITSKEAKTPIFRAHNLKYLKVLTCSADSDFGFGFYVKNYPGNDLSFSNNKYKPIICRPMLLNVLTTASYFTLNNNKKHKLARTSVSLRVTSCDVARFLGQLKGMIVCL